MQEICSKASNKTPLLNSLLEVYISRALVINAEGGKRFVLLCQWEFLLHCLSPRKYQQWTTSVLPGAALAVGLLGSIPIRTLFLGEVFFSESYFPCAVAEDEEITAAMLPLPHMGRRWIWRLNGINRNSHQTKSRTTCWPYCSLLILALFYF